MIFATAKDLELNTSTGRRPFATSIKGTYGERAISVTGDLLLNRLKTRTNNNAFTSHVGDIRRCLPGLSFGRPT